MKSMDAAAALAIATAIMALGAITFSALSLAFQRSHSRKSVRPFCNVNQYLTNTGMSVGIQNAGMGPMRIQKVVLLANEDDSIQNGVPLEDAFPADLKPEAFVHRYDAYVLAPLLEVELFRCAFGAADEETTTRLKSFLNGKVLCVVYSDIYDDVYEKKAVLNAAEPR